MLHDLLNTIYNLQIKNPYFEEWMGAFHQRFYPYDCSVKPTIYATRKQLPGHQQENLE